MTKSLSDNLYKGFAPVSAGGTGGNSTSTALAGLGAQAKLVSGTNIKTINGNSVLAGDNFKFANLTPTAVTTSLYSASASELVRCNTSGGVFTVNLPALPSDGSVIGFSDVNSTFGTSAVTVVPSGATIESDTSLILNIPGINIVVMYNSINNNWEVLHNRTTSFGRIPDAPTIGTATVNQLTATVPFTAPTFNGNATIIKYTATSSPGGKTGSITQAGSGSVTVTGLSYSTSYAFTVVATNEIGDSIASSVSNSISTPTVPSQPTVGTVTLLTITSVTIPFTAPYDGGTTITSFTVTSLPSGFTSTLYQSGNGSFTISNLSSGTSYTFTVTATNAAGTSVASSASNSILIPTVPSQPTIGTATYNFTTNQATVTFTAPNTLNGSTITGYTATSSGGQTASGASSPLIFTGLPIGGSYTFTVVANSNCGNSAASAASNSMTTVLPVGQEAYTIPGTYSWIAPADVTSVSVVCVGGGGGAYDETHPTTVDVNGGGGGALSYINNITVIPGNSYTVVVGAGKGRQQGDGGASSFNTSSCIANGGKMGSFGNGGAGGTVGAGTGGSGGRGGVQNPAGGSNGGGGGAGGYAGTGGLGGSYPSPSRGDGTGGAGAGGSYDYCGAGVGILGQGIDGINGGGGSGGGNSSPGVGGAYGGGGGTSGAGGSGAVRIIWPGTTRSFPTTLTGNL